MKLETLLDLWHREAGEIAAMTGREHTVQGHAYSMTSDLYKSLNGIRPRWLADASVTDLAGEYLLLIQQNERELALARQDAEEQAAAEARLTTPAPWTIGELVNALDRLQIG